jgi:hypothetical protein
MGFGWKRGVLETRHRLLDGRFDFPWFRFPGLDRGELFREGIVGGIRARDSGGRYRSRRVAGSAAAGENQGDNQCSE